MLKTLLRKVTRRTSTSGIKVAGEQDILVRFAKCCSPLPGDPIVGFITRGRGVTVHTLGCTKAIDQDPDRRVQVEWDGKLKQPRPVSVQVMSADKPGILALLSQSFNDLGVNISQAHCRATEDGRAANTCPIRSVPSSSDEATRLRTIRRAEGSDGVVAMTAANAARIVDALKSAGVQFIPRNGGGVGVRLNSSE